MYIAISGNMGSGKTTLTNLLSDHYGWTPRFEAVDYNPYLSDYYKDIPRWAFNLEVYFLKERFKDLLAIAQAEGTIIQDRSIFEGVYVFAATNKAMGQLSDRDFETYMELFESMMMVAKLPDLMIYLRASVPHLVKNIQKRGRDYEQGLSLEYLTNLNQRYEDFIYNRYKGRLLVIEVDELDYLHNPADFKGIVDRIDAEFFGLFAQ
ncbi:MAG: deoxynucleoside kinase [Alloprevotella sp.]|nr:deoxynucleoside kinase [Alloprevotella sp.]